ncbi:hypothetical protein [Nocardia salmonicida]|uniref:hypothetical protein n=1 Tax=Nocardia salmonicida TaxID=53431 RepID=UPI0033F319DA
MAGGTIRVQNGQATSKLQLTDAQRRRERLVCNTFRLVCLGGHRQANRVREEYIRALDYVPQNFDTRDPDFGASFLSYF